MITRSPVRPVDPGAARRRVVLAAALVAVCGALGAAPRPTPDRLTKVQGTVRPGTAAQDADPGQRSPTTAPTPEAAESEARAPEATTDGSPGRPSTAEESARRAELAADLAADIARPAPRIHDENPLIRGWITETLELDYATAREDYLRGATPDADVATRAQCLARLADLDLRAGDRRGAETIAAQLRQLDLAPVRLPPPIGPTIPETLRAMTQARAHEDPVEYAQRIAAVREQVLEAHHNATYSRIRSVLGQVREQIAEAVSTTTSPRRTGMSAGQRRDWVDITQRFLDGRTQEAQRLAWFRLRWSPRTTPTDPAGYVERRLQSVTSVLERRGGSGLSEQERSLFTQLRSHVQAMMARGEHEAAAAFLRQVPPWR